MQRQDYRFCLCCAAPLESRLVKPGDPERLVCSGCGFIFYLDPKLAVGVIVEEEGALLLLRRAIEPGYGRWVFPGGFVDRGEHPEAAAAREAREEAGIEVRLDGLVGVYNEPPGNPVVLVVYRGQRLSGEPAALDESLESRMFGLTEVPWEELAFPSTRAAMRDYVGDSGGK